MTIGPAPMIMMDWMSVRLGMDRFHFATASEDRRADGTAGGTGAAVGAIGLPQASNAELASGRGRTPTAENAQVRLPGQRFVLFSW